MLQLLRALCVGRSHQPAWALTGTDSIVLNVWHVALIRLRRNIQTAAERISLPKG